MITVKEKNKQTNLFSAIKEIFRFLSAMQAISKLKTARRVTQLQYSSQIVDTEAVFLEFSPNFLHSLFPPLFSLKSAPFLPQCWATHTLEH